MTRDQIRERVHSYAYYFIIGIASLFALVFLPMVGSEVGIGFNVPDTKAGWIVWITTRIIVAALNVLIFFSFKQQARVNVVNDANYIKANEILSKVKVREYHPRSPKKYNGGAYAKKGTTIFVTSAFATVALTQAIMSFDYVTLLTYLFTIVMGLVFGLITMLNDEEYWTHEYLDYANSILKEKTDDNNRQQDL